MGIPRVLSLCSFRSRINRSDATVRLSSTDFSGVVSRKEAKRYLMDCLAALKSSEDHAEQLADVLVEADYRGHFSHGLNRIEIYIKDLRAGLCQTKDPPKILKESPATAWVDGVNCLGPVVGNFSMDLAIKKAKECGVGWVAAKGSNHYGIAAWYSMTALKHNLLGMSFTNTSPFLCPTRSKEAALGTNPISLAAPGKNSDSFVLDMATTTVAVGKIEIQKRKKEPIPEGWALDAEGRPTTDAEVGFETKKLMPLGGTEMNSGYKGYGLAVLVEIFCGMLSGSTYGQNVRSWMSAERIANLGQCFIAINPEMFAPGFEERMSDLMTMLRNLPSVDKSKPVLVHGDPERAHMALVDKEGGIRYHENQLKAAAELAKELNIQPMKLEKPKC
ncbi:UNVERIFIED_CONTAM: hypothetical protein PYX00_000817 [Menopon gallinae]|uniref:Malate dehydrogenase n=1 Tax=Menopon gallinae TaxID=328185 RepID=A0AAW2IBA1_9NEOP